MDLVEKEPAGDYTALPATLPPSNIPGGTDILSVASECLKKLGSTLSDDTLTEDTIWRDTYAFTGTLRTFYGSPSVRAVWEKLARVYKPHNFELVPESVRCLEFGSPIAHAWVHAMFTFETESPIPAKCSGFLAITPGSDRGWKIWTIRTMLENFKGLGDVDALESAPSNGTIANGHHTSNGTDGITADNYFDAVVVGAGQAGLSTAGRLNALKISNVVIEVNSGVGSNWLSRYDSAKCIVCPVVKLQADLVCQSAYS